MITKSTPCTNLFLLLFLFLFSCRTETTPDNHPGVSFEFSDTEQTKEFFTWQPGAPRMISAHRGGPYANLPENSMAAFRNSAQLGLAIIECDVALTKDRKLVMMHDDKLDRTTNGRGYLKDYTLQQLGDLFLKDSRYQVTTEKIPTLREVLEWTKGRAFLTLDLKGDVPYQQVIDLIRETGSAPYTGIIAYNINAAKKLYALAPELMLSVPARNQGDLQRLRDSGIPYRNMIGFAGTSEPDKEIYQALHAMKIFAILGTLGNLDKRAEARGDKIYRQLLENGADILATDRPREVFKIIANE